jgi:oxygen-independent coproporphyrinogen-3 oxidase
LEPEHLSAYALTIEPATPLGRNVAAGAVPPPDPDLQADMFALACDVLGAAGYEHYEVSNWSKPGRECRHNLTYWRRNAYLGLGAGAQSFREDRRSWNVRPPEHYLEMVERGERPEGGEELLTPEDAHLEDLFLHLRTREGISATQVQAAAAEPFLEEGLLARRNGNYVLTERGMFLANELVVALSD